jgi:hypothetical protein
MRIDERDLVWIALAVAIAVAVVQSLRLGWSGFVRASRLRARVANAARGEARAERLLRAAGFDVLARQITHRWTAYLDGAPVTFDLRADYLVARDARRFVAEVKIGREAPRITCVATRRQMLEYRCAFDVDGVLLVDMEAERIHAVEFDFSSARAPERAAPSHAGAWLAAAVIAGVAILLAVLTAR